MKLLSEDGQLTFTEKKRSEDWYFLCHLDPMFAVTVKDGIDMVEKSRKRLIYTEYVVSI